MKPKRFFYIFIEIVLAIGGVSLAPASNCILPNSFEKGQCVTLKSCPAVNSDFINPDILEEIQARTEKCKTISSKMVCCEIQMIDNRVPNVMTTKVAITTTTTAKTTTTTAAKTTTRTATKTTTTLKPAQLNIQKNEDTPLDKHKSYKLFDMVKCGKSSLTDRVSNGMDARLNEFPWSARLGYLSENKIGYNCGGTLISQYYVLTAAHCLLNLRGDTKLQSIRLGEHDERTEKDCIDDENCADPVQDIEVESFIGHPGYDPKQLINDIGLIRLKEPAKLTQNNIKTICMPFNENARRITPNYAVAGWGATTNSSRYPVLQKANLPPYDSKECEKKFAAQYAKYNIKITENQICAGGEGLVDACRGDSGMALQGYAILKKQPQMVQYGIVSYGVKLCGQIEKFPGVYTKVSTNLRWILDNMK